MLTSFVLSMAIAAPVPPPAPPVAPGPVPRLLELKPNADGKIMVTVLRTETVKVPVAVNPNGAAAQREVTVTKMMTVELGDVKDLKITTADGKKVELADALKQLKDGATVIVSADGKPVSPNHLKIFKDDVLVLVSPELTGPAGVVGPRPLPGGGLRPVPLPAPVAPGVLPIQPVQPVQPGGVIQIQIQPGQIQVVPLQPVPAPAPAPGK